MFQKSAYLRTFIIIRVLLLATRCKILRLERDADDESVIQINKKSRLKIARIDKLTTGYNIIGI